MSAEQESRAEVERAVQILVDQTSRLLQELGKPLRRAEGGHHPAYSAILFAVLDAYASLDQAERSLRNDPRWTFEDEDGRTGGDLMASSTKRSECCENWILRLP